MTVSVRRILAPNPGIFTGPGTNTYVAVSEDECVIIDPGPIDGSHQDAIMEQAAELQPRAVIVTHTHPDHAPLANPLAGELGVPAYGHSAGPDFDPDRRLRDGDRVRFGRTALDVLHTPGHSDDHLCFRMEGTVFTGDHIMGGSTVIVENMADYLRSLERLQGLEIGRLLPGHGEPMDDPAGKIAEYLSHRRQREEQVLAVLEAGPASVERIVEVVYRDVDRRLHPLAARSVLAHLRKLRDEGRVHGEDAGSSSGGEWRRPDARPAGSPK